MISVRHITPLVLACAAFGWSPSALGATTLRPVDSSSMQHTVLLGEGDEPEVEDKRASIKESCEKFRELIGKRGEQDTAAITLMDTLLQEFPISGPKDRKLIAGTIGKSFDMKRKDLAEGVLDNKLYLSSAVCLGEMGPESAAILTKWIGHKRYRKDLALQMMLVQSLGKTKHAGAVKTLMDLLKDKSPSIISSAAQALGNFAEADLKVRKKIVNDLIRLLMDAKTAVDDDVSDTTARELYDTISAPIITTLQELTGNNERAPEAWQRWWNKNKKKDWDKED